MRRLLPGTDEPPASLRRVDASHKADVTERRRSFVLIYDTT
jgi:hypothetical protein